MWIVKPLVVVGALWLLVETLEGLASGQSLGTAVSDGTTAIGTDLTCAADEFVGLWNGIPTCLHHGGVSGPFDGGAIDSGPVTSPDGL